MVFSRRRLSVSAIARFAGNVAYFSWSRTANACYKDAADLHAELEEYRQAIARYEQVATSSLGSALTRYSVKEYWLKAVLCALAMGVSMKPLRLHRLSDAIECSGSYHSQTEHW
jgi:hypothetical protein